MCDVNCSSAITSHCLLFNIICFRFCFARLLPESLPWLISQKRWAQAKTAAKQIARVNGKDVGEFEHLFPSPCHSDDSSAESLLVPSRAAGDLDTGVSAETELGAAISVSQTDNDSKESVKGCGESSKGSRDEDGAEPTRHSVLDLFRHRQMRLYSCVMFFLL